MHKLEGTVAVHIDKHSHSHLARKIACACAACCMTSQLHIACVYKQTLAPGGPSLYRCGKNRPQGEVEIEPGLANMHLLEEQARSSYVIGATWLLRLAAVCSRSKLDKMTHKDYQSSTAFA